MHDHPRAEALGSRLITSIALNIAITAAQLIGGLLAGSLALVADALHNLSDVAALGLSYFAYRLSRRLATRRYTFAFQRAEVLAALINAAALIGVSIFVGVEAVQRLAHPTPVAGGLVVIFAAFGVVINAGAAFLLRGHGKNLNVRAAVLHLVSDSVASVGVLVAGVLIHFFGVYFVDPLMSLLLSAWMIKESVDLLRTAARILMQGVPEDLELSLVEFAILEIDGIMSVHDLHVWAVAPENVILSAHLVVADESCLTELTPLLATVKNMLHERFAVAHATLEVESAVGGCAGESCGIDE